MANKYRAKKTEADGITFHSLWEAERYQQLRLMEIAGEISDLELQPEFELQPRFKFGKRVIRPIKYLADFRYVEVATGKIIVEDTKGVETEAFRMKRKMLMYVHGIDLLLLKRPKRGSR